jgi:two-component system, chemotaxis family, protein-glutamate methylesterase/glutaminase
MKKTKVLIIDDSLFMRQMIADLLNKDEEIEVVAQADNGEDGLKKLDQFNPDVVTLDYEMPGLNGLATLKKIMRLKPTPVIMVSAYTRKAGMITLSALHEGAVDYVVKPSGPLSLDIRKVGDEIIRKVKIAAKVDVKQLLQFLSKEFSLVDVSKILPTSKAVVIGSSTGGLVGVEKILFAFQADFPAALFVVQHLPELFVESFAQRLNSATSLNVKVPKNGEQVEKGVAYIAPGGWHMEVTCTLKGEQCPEGEAYIQLSKSPVVCGYRPSISVLMKSVAELYGKHAIGILLSGMGVDGVEGMEEIAQRGGKTLVQDKETSVVFGMGGAAVDIGAVDEILPIDEIARRIVALL